MSSRDQLPNCRPHEVFEFDHGRFRYTVGIGPFNDGRTAEIFLWAGVESGTVVEAWSRDAAVVASIAFQYGAHSDVIRKALSRDENGRATGPIGAILGGVPI